MVTTGQLVAAGLSRNGIAKRATRGLLHRRHRGVYSVGHAALSREGELLAAVLAVGEGAALSHASAAELHGLLRWPAREIHVVAPRRRTVQGVHVHRTTLHPLDVVVHRGIPVTNVARMLVDLTDVRTAEEITNVISEAAFRNCFSLEATRRTMARANGRHHLHVLEAALDAYLHGSRGTKSRKEVALLTLLEQAGLPKPLVNTTVEGEEVDAHWPDRRLVVEVDGDGHKRPNVRRDDARRDRLLVAAGWRVVRIDADDFHRRPDRVLSALGRAGLAAARPHDRSAVARARRPKRAARKAAAAGADAGDRARG